MLKLYHGSNVVIDESVSYLENEMETGTIN